MDSEGTGLLITICGPVLTFIVVYLSDGKLDGALVISVFSIVVWLCIGTVITMLLRIAGK